MSDEFVPEDDLVLMRAALQAARAAAVADEVPIGAVVADAGGTIVAVGANTVRSTGDPTGHAEIVALRAAADALGGWNLSGMTLAVTVEPCTMCAGAITLARIDKLVFGCWEPKTGAVGSLWDVIRDPRLPHRMQVRTGVLADESAQVLKDFFRSRRPVD